MNLTRKKNFYHLNCQILLLFFYFGVYAGMSKTPSLQHRVHIVIQIICLAEVLKTNSHSMCRGHKTRNERKTFLMNNDLLPNAKDVPCSFPQEDENCFKGIGESQSRLFHSEFLRLQQQESKPVVFSYSAMNNL